MHGWIQWDRLFIKNQAVDSVSVLTVANSSIIRIDDDCKLGETLNQNENVFWSVHFSVFYKITQW